MRLFFPICVSGVRADTNWVILSLILPIFTEFRDCTACGILCNCEIKLPKLAFPILVNGARPCARLDKAEKSVLPKEFTALPIFVICVATDEEILIFPQVERVRSPFASLFSFSAFSELIPLRAVFNVVNCLATPLNPNPFVADLSFPNVRERLSILLAAFVEDDCTSNCRLSTVISPILLSLLLPKIRKGCITALRCYLKRIIFNPFSAWEVVKVVLFQILREFRL